MNTFRQGPFANIPPVVKNLLIINVLMFLATEVLKMTMGVNLNQHLGLYYFKSDFFRPYQIVTHMFMHGGFYHILINMFMLWMFGRVLEQVWGGRRFLFYYLFTALGAAALHMFVLHLELGPAIRDFAAFRNTPSPDLFDMFISNHVANPNPQIIEFIKSWMNNPGSTAYAEQAIAMLEGWMSAPYTGINVPTVGASGAVYGVLLAFGVLFPNMPLVLIFLPFFPIKAKYMVIGMVVLELISGLSWSSSNIAHFAHLGGMLFGYILIKYWNTSRKDFY